MSTNSPVDVELSSKVNAAAYISSSAASGIGVAQPTDVGGTVLGTNEPTSNSATTPNGQETMVSNAIGLGDGSGNGNCLSLTLMQSSPPPHSYRHSRAYRHFKNPPQPHMCIRTTTEAGEELFINVLSWTRIVIPQEPSDPIPLYGGMRVPPGSPRSPPIVFAVMANPEVLKDSGRHSKDPEERRAMVELMCDFVEAMNPGVKLVRNAIILKDRDISGELKDVWNAVQAQRDREREEQMMQQRQQQHYHNITTQQMFPKSSELMRSTMPQKSDNEIAKTSLDKECRNTITEGVATQAMVMTTVEQSLQQTDNRKVAENEQGQQGLLSSLDGDRLSINSVNKNSIKCAEDAIEKILNGSDKVLGNLGCGKVDNGNSDSSNSNHCVRDVNDSKDQIDASNRLTAKDEVNVAGIKAHGKCNMQATANTTDANAPIVTKHKNVPTNVINSPTSPTAAAAAAAAASSTTTNTTSSTTSLTASTTTVAALTTAPALTPAPTPAPTKKEKLGGFLPNGCIFPRFKNNKHKEKDKDKEKETKSKDKEKTLLNALKKSKEKKVAPIEQNEKTSPDGGDAKSQYEKNCINLESEVQKLDLNKIDSTASTDNMFIKLKVAATSAVAK